jgi:hypothetical protein
VITKFFMVIMVIVRVIGITTVINRVIRVIMVITRFIRIIIMITRVNERYYGAYVNYQGFDDYFKGYWRWYDYY